jgi:PTS system nitrogen regulatory IIA component
MVEAVKAREELHPTALDNGVALMHPRRPQTSILADSVIALGVCPTPIAFSDAGQLTDVFFLICSYDDRTHLRILARLSRLITADDVVDQLRTAESPTAAWEIVRQAEVEAYEDPT